MSEKLKHQLEEKEISVNYIDNLKNGACGFFFQVEVKGEKRKYVCPYDECKTHNDALEYFLSNFYKSSHYGKTLFIKHHIMNQQEIEQLSKAC